MRWPENYQMGLDIPADAAGLDELLGELDGLDGHLDLVGLEGGAPGYVLAQAIQASGRSLLIVTPNLTSAERLVSDLAFHLGPDGADRVALFPPYAHLPFSELTPHPWTLARRIKCLWRLASGEGPVAAVAPVQALLHRLMPRTALNRFAELILVGEEADRDRLVSHLVRGGYAPTALVEEPGDLAVRGGILDVFGPLHDEPLRLEFFGDFVDSLRAFKPHDQRSVRRLKETILLPMNEVILTDESLQAGRQALARLEADPARILKLREPLTTGRPFPGIESFLPLFHPETEGLFDYLEGRGLLCLLDPAEVERAGRDHLDQLAEHQRSLIASDRPHLGAEKIAFSWEETAQSISERPCLNISPLEITKAGQKRVKNFRGQPARPLLGPTPEGEESVLAPLVRAVRRLNEAKIKPWLVCRTEGQLKRLGELLAGYELRAQITSDRPKDGEEGTQDISLVLGGLSAGFFLPRPGLVVLTEEEALGQARVRSSSKAGPAPPAIRLESYAELSQGNLVVHTEHGIGRYAGLVNMAVDGVMGDFLLLEYQDADRLYVPADRLNLIQKYAGPESKKPHPDRLGGMNWRKTKSRVKRRLMEIVQELIDLYAVRQVADGHGFSGRDELFREFEATFEYEETADQMAAIEEVLKDMQRPQPMDRLVCGDVGYGKTEVALRAVFRAVMDGKQAALLVPTTILAEQHGDTFAQRLAPYPIRVEVLSRFKTQAVQRKILADLKKGLVDVVIGTHRLFQKDVAFRRLGLLIVDEEHRFGVKDKEKLKQLRQTVDVLALTATPIPRTLQMSLFSIRDLSVINTPPQDRQAITTYLSPFDPAAIQEAIGRELGRGGQVFFVHNRVKDIVRMANLVQRLAPLARVEVAHGQMSERVLERVMLKFSRGEVDVLVTTTIIESGLDIPAANTIIINNADKLGLAQIYQLRGRVGRSAERAYAYLLIPQASTLSRDAQKRLKVLMDFTHLGAGFKIALHDLQIRGGGNLLGQAQSGQVGAVGYEMYLSLMEQAVAELKGSTTSRSIDPELHLPFSAFLPQDYIPEPNQRLLLYRRLSGAEDEVEVQDLIAEMIDRFGPLPQEAANLAEAIRLKLVLRRAGIKRLDAAEGQAALTFAPEPPLAPERLVSLVRSNPKRYKLTPDMRLIITAKKALVETKSVLEGLLNG